MSIVERRWADIATRNAGDHVSSKCQTEQLLSVTLDFKWCKRSNGWKKKLL